MGEAQDNRLKKRVYVVTDSDERPITHGSKVTAYLTLGMADAALDRAKKEYKNNDLKLTTYIPESTRLIFMDDEDDDE